MTKTAGSQRILLVENNDDLRMRLASWLSHQGYKVQEVSNGLHALEKIKSGMRFEAVICDLQMPALSGLNVLNQLRASGSAVPFFLMAKVGEKKQINDALRKGACHVFLKPLEKEQFLEELDRHLQPQSESTKAA